MEWWYSMEWSEYNRYTRRQTADQQPNRMYESRSSVHSRNAFRIMDPARTKAWTHLQVHPGELLAEAYMSVRVSNTA